MRYILTYFFSGLLVTANCFAQQDTIIEKDSVPPAYENFIEKASEDEPDGGSQQYFLEYNWPDSPIRMRNIPDSLVSDLKKNDDFWYVQALNKIKQGTNDPGQIIPRTRDSTGKIKEVVVPSEAKTFTNQSWFQTLLWIVTICGFAGFVIWYLASSNVGLFGKKKRLISDKAEEEDLSEEDLFAINYSKQIDNAVRQGNYRLAVRLMFLRLLKNLSERNVIEYRQGKTNFDYLLQLQTTRYYPDFFRITRNYEYSWYGQFEVNEEKFALIRKDFEQFENRLK